ncbi:hypothetical protein [Streptomyces indicus]|uniref:hypothetical protein n=1 Tax=Streptomyces indicus TaxID=417292 RepID=UPI000B89BE59|nr:hypothetical protein [Streptomyces indicus]
MVPDPRLGALPQRHLVLLLSLSPVHATRLGCQPGDAVVYERGADAWHRYDLGIPFYLPRHLHLPEASGGGAERIWVVVHGQPSDARQELEADQVRALRAQHRVARTERLTGLSVALLEQQERQA